MVYFSREKLPPQLLALVAIYVVPPIASKQRLVEQCSVGAQERAALFSFASIVTYVVCLATSLRVGVHSRYSGNVLTAEAGRRNRVVNRIIVARDARNIFELLALVLLLLLLVDTSYDDRSMVVVHFFVLRLCVFGQHWGSSWAIVLEVRRLLSES